MRRSPTSSPRCRPRPSIAPPRSSILGTAAVPDTGRGQLGEPTHASSQVQGPPRARRRRHGQGLQGRCSSARPASSAPSSSSSSQDASDAGHVRMFVDEARRYAVLDHENIGRIFDFERRRRRALHHPRVHRRLEPDRVPRAPPRAAAACPTSTSSVFIASRVCRALQYVFERAAIVHRDISPSNIMMTREGTVKLIDFGIATRSGTRDYSLTGKPAYMAPEMVVELRADNRSDLFSLGAVLFEMLTGRAPLPGQDDGGGPRAGHRRRITLAAHVQPRHPRRRRWPIVRTALQRDPPMRYASAGEMGEACEHYPLRQGLRAHQPHPEAAT